MLLLGGDDGPGPEAVVRDYITAIDNGNIQEANSLLHPDANRLSGLVTLGSPEIRQIETLSRGGGEARLRVRLRVEALGQSDTTSFVFEMRKTDGEWVIYDDGGIGLDD